jgi:CheY-like chemotaxis protein
VIALPLHNAFTHQRRCREAGAKRFFEKPVTNLRLMTAIQQLLE